MHLCVGVGVEGRKVRAGFKYINISIIFIEI